MRTEHARFENPENALAATAPYNFVRLPEQWLAVSEEQKAADHDCYKADRKSGWISLTITALTPLFIRGTLTSDEYKEPGENDRPKAQTKFFQPAQKGRIPGSTLRGMTRNLVEIISESQVKDAFDQPLHFRTFDGSAIAKYYADQRDCAMVRRNGNAFASDISAGYIRRERGNYCLYPAKTLSGTQFYRIERAEITFSINYDWDRMPVWFRPIAPALQRHRRSDLWYAKISGSDCVSRDLKKDGKDKPGTGWHEGVLVVSGDVEGKHLHWIIGPLEDTSIATFAPEEEVISTYKEGGIPEGHASFSVLPDQDNEPIPCFYKKWKTGEIRFGHTGMFRLPYQHTPQALLKELLGASDSDGLAEQIFGTAADSADGRAGSIYFEDALLTSPIQEWQDEERQPRVLGTPHPTTFPHYVSQNNAKLKMRDGEPSRKDGYLQIDAAALKHWDSPDATPRGNKMYWHRWPKQEGQSLHWFETSNLQPSELRSHPPRVRAANANTVFEGRIRFDNLTEAQIGALLFALQLPAGRAHKIGMGKPLGLGSVRIKCQLHLIDRMLRYKQLFTEDGHSWKDEATDETERISEFQNAFAGWVLGRQGEAVNALWSQARMQELDTMLDFGNRPDPEKTEYLQGPNPPLTTGEFGKRKVLPSPLQVVGKRANNPVQRATAPTATEQKTKPSSPSQVSEPDVQRAQPAQPIHESPESKTYTLGQEMMVEVVEKGNTAVVLLANGEKLPGQNVGGCFVNQKVKMFIAELDGNRIIKLTRDKALAAQLRQLDK